MASLRLRNLFGLPLLLFGSLFALLIPPFQSPDEPNHLFRAYQVSEGSFFPEQHEQRLGGTLPASLTQVRDSFVYLKMNYSARLEIALTTRFLEIPLKPAQRTFTDFPNTAVYAPTAYLPQAAAIALIRPLGATPLQMLYAARLSNLLVWVLLVQAAVRLMPFLRHTLTALALLPASLVVAASANADVVTNGLCWWLVAWMLGGAPPNGGNGERLAVVASLAAACANKLIVIPLVLAHWLRPAPAARRLQFGILAAVALAAALAWGSLAQHWFVPYDRYNPAFRDAQTLNEGVDPAQQQAFILKNPLFFIKTATTSAVRALPSTAAHIVGKFGWEKNYLSPAWIGLLWLSLAILLASEKNPLSGRQRLLAGGIVALYVALFAVTMYTLWNAVGAAEVTNFQGRYFVPILPVAALALAGGWLFRFQGKIWWCVVCVLFLSNGAMLASIWERYY